MSVPDPEWAQQVHDYRRMVCDSCPLERTVYFGWDNPITFCAYPGDGSTHFMLNVDDAQHGGRAAWDDPEKACPWTRGWRQAVYPDIGEAYG